LQNNLASLIGTVVTCQWSPSNLAVIYAAPSWQLEAVLFIWLSSGRSLY